MSDAGDQPASTRTETGVSDAGDQRAATKSQTGVDGGGMVQAGGGGKGGEVSAKRKQVPKGAIVM